MGACRRLEPIHADCIACIRERTKAKVSFHTDGGVFDLVLRCTNTATYLCPQD